MNDSAKSQAGRLLSTTDLFGGLNHLKTPTATHSQPPIAVPYDEQWKGVIGKYSVSLEELVAWGKERRRRNLEAKGERQQDDEQLLSEESIEQLLDYDLDWIFEQRALKEEGEKTHLENPLQPIESLDQGLLHRRHLADPLEKKDQQHFRNEDNIHDLDVLETEAEMQQSVPQYCEVDQYPIHEDGKTLSRQKGSLGSIFLPNKELTDR